MAAVEQEPVTEDDLALARLRRRTRRTAAIVVPVEDGEVTLRFQAIPSPQFDDLADAHPRRADSPKGYWFHLPTFGPALIAASSTTPRLTAEDVAVWWDEWESGLVTGLFLTVLDLNTSRPSIPKESNASGETGTVVSS